MALQETTRMVLKSTAKSRILATLRSLAMSKVKQARISHCCGFCACPILLGAEFRTAGKEDYHDDCFKAVNREYNKK